MTLRKLFLGSTALLAASSILLTYDSAHAIEVTPGPKAKQIALEQALEAQALEAQAAEQQETKKIEDQTSQDSRFQSHNQDLLWVDQVDDTYVLRGNITATEFQANGVGVGNLIAALYAHPNIQLMDRESAKDAIIDSNLKGVEFKDARFKQLQSCLEEQVVRNEVKNADPSRTTNVWTYQTNNLLLFNPTAGTDQSPSITSQVSCELDAYFVEELISKGGASLDTVPTNLHPAFDQEDMFLAPTRTSIALLVSSESTDKFAIDTDLSNTVSESFAVGSEYSVLKKSLRTADNSLINSASISINEQQATYDLFQQVSIGEVQLSNEETKQLAIDVYNVLGDQKSEYFVTVKDINSQLGVKENLRAEATALNGFGRREQNVKRKDAFRTELANMYQTHLQESNGTTDSFSLWKKQMRTNGASRYDLNMIINETPYSKLDLLS